MICGDRFRLFIYPDGEGFFYDLENDPKETKNLVGNSAYKQEVLRLENALEEWLVETGWKGAAIKYKYRS